MAGLPLAERLTATWRQAGGTQWPPALWLNGDRVWGLGWHKVHLSMGALRSRLICVGKGDSMGAGDLMN